MQAVIRIIVGMCVVFVSLGWAATTSHAITITYSNPGPSDGVVYGGFTNIVQVSQPGFYTTTDFLTHQNVISRADTAIGHGTFPNTESTATSRVEIGTNLEHPTGAGVRSVFAPIVNGSTVSARGQTYQPGPNGNYSAHSFVHSGDASSGMTPTPWVIFVDPEGGEVVGTPVDVTIDASVVGSLSVAGTGSADASWTVATTTHGGVIAGTQSLATAGTSPINDSGSLTFTIPLGSSFELFVYYDFDAAGSGAGANSFSEFTASLVEISAAIAPPMLAVNFGNPLGNGTTATQPAGPFNQNQNIPVKIAVLDAGGQAVADALASTLDVRINVFYDLPVPSLVPVNAGNNAFKHLDDNKFKFNLKMNNQVYLPGYSYRIVVDVDGVPVGEAFFAL